MKKKHLKQTDEIEREIESLQRKIRKLQGQKKQRAQMNDRRRKVAHEFSDDLRDRATPAEIRFLDIIRKKHLPLEFQAPIYINNSGDIERFYIADFCDRDKRIVIEIDGGYHNDAWQYNKDIERTNRLRTMGYTVYRITNKEVMSGESTKFLYSIYKWPV